MKPLARNFLSWPVMLGMGALAMMSLNSRALDLVVAMTEGPATQTLEVPLHVSDPSGVAGLACTLSFDTTALDVAVRSDFFGTFAEQYAAASVVGPRAVSVDYQGVTFDRPLLVKPLPGKGLAVAAVRRTAASPAFAGVPLLTLQVQLKPAARPGTYPIHLESTIVDRTEAGYDAAGEPLDLVIGRDPLNGTFPVLLTAADVPAHAVPGGVVFWPPGHDDDQDGLPDWWELEQFKALSVATATTDTDGDGKPDLLEYFQGTDANTPDTAGLLMGEVDADVFRVFYPRRRDSGLNAVVQWTEDFASWSDKGVTVKPRPDLGSGPDWEMVEAALPTAGRATRFVRLRIDL